MSAAKRLLAELLYGEDTESSCGNMYVKPKSLKRGRIALSDPTKPLSAKQILMADLAAIGLNGTDLSEIFVNAKRDWGRRSNKGGYCLRVLREPRVAARVEETKKDILAEAKEKMSSYALKAAEVVTAKVEAGDFKAATYLLDHVTQKNGNVVKTINTLGPINFGMFLGTAAESKTIMHDITGHAREISSELIDVSPVEGERIGGNF